MQDAHHFEHGKLVVFRRGAVFYARLHKKTKGYVWRSLKTSDEQTAIAAAYELYYKSIYKNAQGLPFSQLKMADVIKRYIAYREKSHRHGKTSEHMLRQVKRASRFWFEYIGHVPIEFVGDKELREYLDWRRDYYTRLGHLPKNAKLVPVDKTLQWEIMLAKAVLKWAHEKGLRGTKPLPTFCFTAKRVRARPAFELYEYRLLLKTMERRIRECPDARWLQSRQLLKHYVVILANSGIRVGEANNLKVRDVRPFRDEKGRNNYRFIVRGKTGERDVIMRASAARYVQRMLHFGEHTEPDDWFFSMSDGSKIITLIDQFKAPLRDGGIIQSSNGEQYCLYSLRHFYAVMQLRRGIGVFELARNMGTSVQMIQQYYGRHATARTFATRLGD